VNTYDDRNPRKKHGAKISRFTVMQYGMKYKCTHQ
jgi:hypothetical protein